MAPKMKVYFFDARARVEIIQLILAAAKVDYEMITFDQAGWESKYFKEMPFGKVPVLEIDGKKYGQSLAIQSYLAEEYDMNGSSNHDRLIINQFMALREDFMAEEAEIFHISSPEKREDNMKHLFPARARRYLCHFSSLVKEYSQGKDFVLGDKLSAADLAIFAGTTTVEQEQPNLLAKFPELAQLRKRVSEVDGIKQYLAKRKQTVI